MELFVERVADDARGYRWMLARSVAVIDGKPLPLATFDQRRWHGRSTDQILTQRRQIMAMRSEEHTSELQSLMRISYAVFCLKKKNIRLNTKLVKCESN